MIGKKINQLATELAPANTDLTIIGDPTTGVSKKITLAQLGAIFSGAVSFYNDLASFPTTGDINVIYCAKDTQKLYLWSGSAYTEVFPSQALLNTYQLRSEKGVSNGYASLDSGGKVPISQLPSSIMEYKGTWSAATNTPTLANGTGNTGDVYLCNAAGSVNFGAGPITFAVGDYVVYSGSIYQRSSGAVGTVTSVGLSITGNAIGVSNSPITTSGTLALAFAGTSVQYINGAGSLTTFPSLTGFVPYTGATGQVNLGAYDLLVQTLTIGKGNSGLSNNTALGYRTLFHITTGNYNTAVGYEAAHNTTTGQYNTALGQSALFTNTTGSQNTALGLNSLLSNTTGGSNVVVGLDAMQHNTTGSSNTALGYNAGSHITGGSTPNTTASNSVYIGRDSKAKVDGGANEIVIGYNAIGNGSNTATFGNTSTTANYFTGSINGGSFVKSGGTSTQFLKADGSVDSNTYLTTSAASSTYLPLILNSSANTVDINGQQFTIQGSAGGFTSGRIIVDPVFSALGYQNSGVFDGLKILTNGNAEFTNSGVTRFFNQVRFDSTLTNGTYTYTLPGATGTIALVGGAGVGTVTSVGLSSATSGVTIGSTPITTSGTITLAIATASGSQQGLLSSTDWTTFNNKQNALTNPVTGTGTTNYLPKFTGASTIGNSQIFDNGTNVGIATTSLVADALLPIQINAGASGQAYFASNNNGGYGLLMGYDNANGYARIRNVSNTALTFETNNSEKMRLNASGSLGLGVTPSAWSSTVKAFEIGGGGQFIGAYGGTDLWSGTNMFYEGTTFKYKESSRNVTLYSQSSGAHVWLNAPSGTAGNAISFTQAMTLDASGNLMLGGTTQLGKATIIGDNNDANSGQLVIAGATSTNKRTSIGYNTTGNYGFISVYTALSGYNPLALQPNGGNVGIGTTSPTANLDISGTSSVIGKLRTSSSGGVALFTTVNDLGNTTEIGTWGSTRTGFGAIQPDNGYIFSGVDLSIGSSTNIKFGTGSGNTERIRITSGGSLLVGTSTDSGKIYAVGSSTQNGLLVSSGSTSSHYVALFRNTSESLNIMSIKADGNVGINTTSPSYLLDVNGTARFGSAIVASLGTGLVYSSGGTLTSTNPSDQRLKNTIKALSYGLNEILQLNPKTFYYNDDVNKERLKYGFIAQEVKGIMPELARKLNAETDYLGLETEGIYVTLVNAIKELKAELDTLKNK